MKLPSVLVLVVVAGMSVGCETVQMHDGTQIRMIPGSVNGLEIVIENNSSTPQIILPGPNAGGCFFLQSEALREGKIVILPNEDYSLYVRPYGQTFSFELKAKAFDPKLCAAYGRYQRATFYVPTNDLAIRHWSLYDQNPPGLPPSMISPR